MEKSREQLERALDIKNAIEDHRKDSDKRYAIKLVERVLWALLASAFLFLAGWYFSHLVESKKPTTDLQQIVSPSVIQ